MSKNEQAFDFKKLNEISSEYGDAFYILDIDLFNQNYNDFITSFRNIYPKSNIGYSYKTNYTPDICIEVDKAGGYAEVVSEMELELALRLGVLPVNIIYNGPYKSKISFEKCLLLGGCVNISSEYEITMLHNLAEDYPDKKINVGIRCNFDIVGGDSRFGFDVESPAFSEMFAELQKIDNINVKGFHCHLPNRDLASYKERIHSLLKLSDKYFETPPEFIDCGGGYFGIMPESLSDQFSAPIVSFDEYAGTIASALKQHYSNYSIDQCPELILEPGSALVANTMFFVAKVINVKKIRGKNIATVAGSNFNISPTASAINLPINVLSPIEHKVNKKKYDIVGYTCIESDILYRNYGGRVNVDDYVCFENVGSYSIVMKPPFILPNVPVISFNSDGSVHLIKEKECFNDIFKGFTLLEKARENK